MIRCTIELIPGGDEKSERRSVIGSVEIANIGGNVNTGHYRVLLKKNLGRITKDNWRSAVLGAPDLEEVMQGQVVGFPRRKLGPYDLLYRALKACGLDVRN